MEGTPEAEGETIRFLRFIYQRRKPVLITFVAALLLAAVISFIVPARYSSSAIIFPVYSNSLESVIDNPAFGYDVEADRLLQLLESDEVRDSVVKKFDLDKYYETDRSTPDWNDELRQKFVKDVKFERTPYMSIVITAVTRKPELSADMANYIIHLADGVRGRIFKENEKTAFLQVEKEYNSKLHAVDSLKTKIETLRHSSGAGLVALINMEGNVQSVGGADKQQMSTELERSLNQYIFEQSRLNEITSRYEKAKAQYESPVTQVYVVDHARVSFKKVSPSFLLNMAVAGFCSLIFSAAFLVFLEKFRQVRQS